MLASWTNDVHMTGGFACDGCDGAIIDMPVTRLEIEDSAQHPFTKQHPGVLTLYARNNDRLVFDIVTFDRPGGSRTGTRGYVSSPPVDSRDRSSSVFIVEMQGRSWGRRCGLNSYANYR